MKYSIKQLSRMAVIAAIYAAICIFLRPLCFGMLQLRISEALCMLPVFVPEASLGLFIGCIISNLFGTSAFPVADAVFGSLATLISAILTRKIYLLTKNLSFALFPPVIVNALIVGTYIPFIYVSTTAVSAKLIILSIFSIGISQALVIYLLAFPLAKLLNKNKFLTTL